MRRVFFSLSSLFTVSHFFPPSKALVLSTLSFFPVLDVLLFFHAQQSMHVMLESISCYTGVLGFPWACSTRFQVFSRSLPDTVNRKKLVKTHYYCETHRKLKTWSGFHTVSICFRFCDRLWYRDNLRINLSRGCGLGGCGGDGGGGRTWRAGPTPPWARGRTDRPAKTEVPGHVCVSGAPYTSPPPGLHHAYHTLPGHTCRGHTSSRHDHASSTTRRPYVPHSCIALPLNGGRSAYTIFHMPTAPYRSTSTYSLISSHHDHTRPVTTHHPPNDPLSPPCCPPAPPSQALSVCCPLQAPDAGGEAPFSPSLTAPVQPIGPPLSPPPLIVTKWLRW